jgi:hypothetical protein
MDKIFKGIVIVVRMLKRKSRMLQKAVVLVVRGMRIREGVVD